MSVLVTEKGKTFLCSHYLCGYLRLTSSLKPFRVAINKFQRLFSEEIWYGMYVCLYICEEVVERRKIMYLKWHLLLCLSLSHVPFEKMLWYPQHIMWCVTDGLYVCFHLYFWHVKTIICLLARNVLFLRCYCCTFIYLSLSAATAARTPSLTCFYAKSQDIAVICSFYYEEMSERNVSMYVARGMLMWHVTCNVCVCVCQWETLMWAFYSSSFSLTCFI